MRESSYQSYLIETLTDLFPGCFILKNDEQYLQGIPDLLVLYRDKWAMLEVKASARARVRPNQEYYVDLLDDMHFAAFIYPENEKDVLSALQSAFKARRPARVSQR